jgi:hypothetical protein
MPGLDAKLRVVVQPDGELVEDLAYEADTDENGTDEAEVNTASAGDPTAAEDAG